MEIYVFLLLLINHYRARNDDSISSLCGESLLGTIRRNGYLYFLLSITVKMVNWLMVGTYTVPSAACLWFSGP